MKWLAFALLLVAVCGVPAAAPATADDSAPCADARYCTYELPYRSDRWVDDYHLALQRHVLLALGYTSGAPTTCPPRLAAAPGVTRAVAFHKRTGDVTHCLEIGLEAIRDDRFRVAILGGKVGADGKVATNPDVAAVRAECPRVFADVDAAPLGSPSDRYLTYQLSYVEADHALAMLAELGYSVVDYQVSKNTSTGVTTITPSEPETLRRPLILEMLDSGHTSLVGGEATDGPNKTLAGGSQMNEITSGIPEQRLLIVYDADEKQSVEALVNLLTEQIDVPARQVLFEALVIEISRDRLRDLGLSYNGSKDGQTFSFQSDGETAPFIATFARPSIKSVLNLTATLRAVIEEGEGTVISRPSVMVLDGRQARIKIADEIPYLKLVQGGNATPAEERLFSTDYLTAGIILNLRPRSNQDGSEITTQVETIISSAGPSDETDSGLPIAPRVQSREVQTFVRVANDTPFIIGGLLAQDQNRQTSRVPFLSKIPGLGWLFKRQSRNDDRREVVVMITPHLIEPDDRSFTYAIPRGSDRFDAFGNELFRNIYRLRPDDIFDLGFLHQGPKLQVLRQTVDECTLKIASTGSTTVPKIDRSLIADFVRSHFEHQHTPAKSTDRSGGGDDVEKKDGKHEPPSRFAALTRQGYSKSESYLQGQPPPPSQSPSQSTVITSPERPTTDPVETFLQVLENGVPGEEILVARMLMQTLQNARFDPFVERVHDVGLFRNTSKSPDGRLRLIALERVPRESTDCDPKEPTCTLILKIAVPVTVPATAPAQKANQNDGENAEFFPPMVETSWEKIEDDEFIERLKALNEGGQRAILINKGFEMDDRDSPSPMRRLQYALLMKRLLELNERADLLTLDGFHVGRELVIPTLDELANRRHVIDRRTADFFYQSYDYYLAFEERFGKLTDELAHFLSADPKCSELMGSTRNATADRREGDAEKTKEDGIDVEGLVPIEAPVAPEGD